MLRNVRLLCIGISILLAMPILGMNKNNGSSNSATPMQGGKSKAVLKGVLNLSDDSQGDESDSHSIKEIEKKRKLDKQKNKNICDFLVDGKPCGRLCNSSNALISHKASHTGEKPFACNKCIKKYCDYNSLREHLRRHKDRTLGKNSVTTRAKKISCSFPGCSKKCSSEAYLKVHYKAHFEKYQCGYCNQKPYNYKADCRHHIKNQHPGEDRTNIIIVKKIDDDSTNTVDNGNKNLDDGNAKIINSLGNNSNQSAPPILPSIKIKRCVECKKLFQPAVFNQHECPNRAMQFSNSNASVGAATVEKMEFSPEYAEFGKSGLDINEFESLSNPASTNSNGNGFDPLFVPDSMHKNYLADSQLSALLDTDKTFFSDEHIVESEIAMPTESMGDLSKIIGQETQNTPVGAKQADFADVLSREQNEFSEPSAQLIAWAIKRKPEGEPELGDRQQAKKLKH